MILVVHLSACMGWERIRNSFGEMDLRNIDRIDSDAQRTVVVKP